MQLFTKIDDGLAIVRLKGSLYKQLPIYHREGKVFIGISGGFLRITDKFDTYGTANPDIKVVDIEGTGLILDEKKAPTYGQENKQGNVKLASTTG